LKIFFLLEDLRAFLAESVIGIVYESLELRAKSLE
jgi:hypothetical protein